MARIGLRRENIKSIILTKDKEFKRKVVTFLNAAAFAAEKMTVDSMAAALDYVAGDRDCLHFVLDGSNLTTEELRFNLELFSKHPAASELKLMVYLSGSGKAEADLITELAPQSQVFALPMSQVHFNKAFNTSRNIALGALNNDKAEASASKKASPSEPSKAGLTLIETSAHLKDTVELLNSVSKDKGRIDAVRSIGQKFNGLIGAFAFLRQSPGYASMQQLAQIVDDVSRTYRDDHSLTITEEHWGLLVESAKTLYMILKDLRENRPPQAASLAAADALQQRYGQAQGLCRRASQSQDDIDALLETELFNKLG